MHRQELLDQLETASRLVCCISGAERVVFVPSLKMMNKTSTGKHVPLLVKTACKTKLTLTQSWWEITGSKGYDHISTAVLKYNPNNTHVELYIGCLTYVFRGGGLYTLSCTYPLPSPPPKDSPKKMDSGLDWGSSFGCDTWHFPLIFPWARILRKPQGGEPRNELFIWIYLLWLRLRVCEPQHVDTWPDRRAQLHNDELRPTRHESITTWLLCGYKP